MINSYHSNIMIFNFNQSYTKKPYILTNCSYWFKYMILGCYHSGHNIGGIF